MHDGNKNAHKILVGKPQVKRPFGDQGIDGRIILTIAML
jgi:hypothetical protein